MPFARIDLAQGKTQEYRAAVADIVYQGIVGVLKGPPQVWGCECQSGIFASVV